MVTTDCLLWILFLYLRLDNIVNIYNIYNIPYDDYIPTYHDHTFSYLQLISNSCR